MAQKAVPEKSQNSPGQAQHSHDLLPNADLSSSLSDVSLYSLSGLVAVSLTQLFEDDCHREFRKKTLEKVLQDLKQPKQVSDSIMMIIEGEIMDNSSAFVDSLADDECLKASRQPIVAYLIALAIKDGRYDARSRMLVKHVAWQLRVSWDEVEDIETELAETLEYNTYVMSDAAKKEREEAAEKAKKAKNRKIKRYALIGLATVGGGALIGLTGGLAAPLVAAGAGAIIGAGGAAALGSAAGVAIIGSLFGVAGAGLTGYKMKRRVGAIEEFSFEPLTMMGSSLQAHRTVKQLHITIAVTGWLNETHSDFRSPWSALADSKEQYSLRWESKYLFTLGAAFDYLLQTGVSMATTEALKYTVLSGLIAAITWPAALISASNVIDNPWHVCTQRSEAAGKQLAEVLLAREQGNRPVSLIGFSMGARVIFYCLEELSKRKGSEGLIEDVVLLGAPVSGDAKSWKPFSKIVAGKIINGYSRGDWLLKFLYRTANVKLNVAGLAPVKWENRRMHNIDLTDVIDGHGDYMRNLDIIMKAVGVRTKDELKTTVPKSGSKTNIPKVAGHDSAISDSQKSISAKDKSENVERSENVEGASLGDQDRTNEELENASNEKKEVKANIKTNNTAPTSNKAIDSADLKTEKGAEQKKFQQENSPSAIDNTSSESEPPRKEHTPEVRSIHDQGLSVDLNANAAVKQRFDEHSTKNTDIKSKTNQKQPEFSEMRKVKRLESEVNDFIKSKDEGKDEDGCYFTDSDPEGDHEAED